MKIKCSSSVAALTLFAGFSLSAGQQSPVSSSAAGGEAVKTGTKFLRSLGFIPNRAPINVFKHPDLLDAEAIAVDFGDGYTMTLDHSGKKVLSFVNGHKTQEQLAASRMRALRPVVSEQVAESWARDLRSRLGLSADYKRTRLAVFPDGGKTADANRVGVVLIAFERPLSGRRCFNFIPGVTVQLDPHDGTVMTYEMCPGPSASGSLKITEAEALRAASFAIPSHSQAGAPVSGILGYAVPNGEFGSVSAISTLVARLVWSFSSGKTTVWIDAETGRCMGGHVLKGKSR